MANTPLSNIKSTTATALAIGQNGATNPVLQVDASTASQATGVKHVGKASGAGVASTAISSGANENWNLDAKGSGQIILNGLTGSGPIVFGQLMYMKTVNNITAFSGGGQGSATVLTGEINNITTATANGASVLLPASVAGLDVIIINNSPNTIQVFGAGTDTVNGVAAATGVSQMPNSCCYYVCPVAGAWFADVGLGYSGNLPTQNYTEGMTARAGGGRASATPITTSLTRVTTVASANDSVVLPTAAPGIYLTIINAGANAMQVFAAGSDTIDGVAGATGYSQPAGKTVNYATTATGAWHKMISA